MGEKRSSIQVFARRSVDPGGISTTAAQYVQRHERDFAGIGKRSPCQSCRTTFVWHFTKDEVNLMGNGERPLFSKPVGSMRDRVIDTLTREGQLRGRTVLIPH